MPGGRRLEHDWLDEPLPANVEVGEGSWVYSAFAFLNHASRRRIGVRIGAHTGVYGGTFFDLGPDGEVEVGASCSIVGAIISTNERVSIGDHVLIAHEVVIADRAFARPPVRDAIPGEGGITIGSDAWIGMRAVILGRVTIGEGAIIAAGAVVRDDVPAHCTAAGNPARVVRSPG